MRQPSCKLTWNELSRLDNFKQRDKSELVRIKGVIAAKPLVTDETAMRLIDCDAHRKQNRLSTPREACVRAGLF